METKRILMLKHQTNGRCDRRQNPIHNSSKKKKSKNSKQ